MKLKTVLNRLREGKSTSWSEPGHSMEPVIGHNEKFKVEPIIKIGDIVLCTVSLDKNRIHIPEYTVTHIVSGIELFDNVVYYEISNIRKEISGWVKIEDIHGRIVV